MPPRLLVLAVLVFWGATTSWLFVREVYPRMIAGQPPPFTIDLTDEVGANTVGWRVLNKEGERLATAISIVRRVKDSKDRIFELWSEVKFEKMEILFLDVRKITWSYRVTPEGKLLQANGLVKFRLKFDKIHDADVEATMSAPVEDGFVKPSFTWQQQTFASQPIPLSDKWSVLNPMGMVNKIDGLYTGRSWEMVLLDSLPLDLPGLGQEMLVPKVIAEVSDDVLKWPIDDAVACYRIDYRKPGEDDVIGSTWVRRRDGIVLQQHAKLHGLEMYLIRENR